VQPMLKLLRDSNNAAPPFAPGPAEKQFRSLMDVELAQRIVNSANFPLVDALARRLKSPQSTLEASA
jgi:Rod binding domain-containing protein